MQKSSSGQPKAEPRSITDRVLSPPEVAAKLGIALSTLYKAIQDGEIKPAIRITANRTGWPESEIQEFIEKRKRERDERLQAA